MSKFNFPSLSSQDEKVIRNYCKLMGYDCIIDRAKKQAKIVAFGRSLYIIKTTLEDGKIVLLSAKTDFKDGQLVYIYTENLVEKYKEALEGAAIFGNKLNGKFIHFYRSMYGLVFFMKQELSLCDNKQ